MRRAVLLGVLAVSSFAASEASAQVAGLNLGAPVYDGVVAKDALAATIATGAPQVRVNFRLDKWTSPNDTARYDGKTFFEAYDGIVDAIVSQGLEVYGLVSDELAPGAPGTKAFEDAYAANASAVIDHFKDRVRVWESINEPNDYAGGSSARFSPSAFARAHGRLFGATKGAHPGDACWGVTLVSGPLFSFDGTNAADYLDQTLAALGGPDAIDGVGYHLYVAQGSDSPRSEVAARSAANLDAIRAVLAARGLGDRKVWVSEIGFEVSAVDEAEQAARLDAAFDALGARSDVAAIHWFTIADFGGHGWGLYRGDTTPGSRRPAYARFVAAAEAHAPELAARLAVSLPARVPAGAKVTAKVTATNIGKRAWSAADQVRLGAASGCPSAWATNTWTWSVAAPDGYVQSALDARRNLPAAANVAQGQSVSFDVPLVAPPTPGPARFAARMVREGEAWFGATAIADVEIASSDASTSDPPPAITTPPTSSPSGPRAPGDASSGCAAGSRGSSRSSFDALAGLAIVVLARRRRWHKMVRWGSLAARWYSSCRSRRRATR